MRLAALRALRPLTLAGVAALSACTVYQAPPQQRVYAQPVPAPVYQPAPVYVEAAPQPVVSIYVEPPVLQPAPILIGWAPPPMLVETVAPLPFASAVWVGGYWVWEGNWVWAAGRWMPAPQPNYAWVHPYYENRDGAVVFITGHWSPPGVVFIPPPLGLRLTLATPAIGVSVGLRPIGPPGVFVPAPPGSRLGLIVPAPIGTPPAVVTSAAPVVNVGMRIQNNTRITNVSNTTTVNNITNVTIVAPASATANGKAFESAVPAQAHLAAALPAVVRAAAPTPVSAKPIPAFVPGRAPVTLPPAQVVRTGPVALTPRPGADAAAAAPVVPNEVRKPNAPAPATAVAPQPMPPRDRSTIAAVPPRPEPAAQATARAVPDRSVEKTFPKAAAKPSEDGRQRAKQEHEGKPPAKAKEHPAKKAEDAEKEKSAK